MCSTMRLIFNLCRKLDNSIGFLMFILSPAANLWRRLFLPEWQRSRYSTCYCEIEYVCYCSVSNIVLANQLMFIQGVPQIRVRSIEASERWIIFVGEKKKLWLKNLKVKTEDVVGLLNLFPTLIFNIQRVIQYSTSHSTFNYSFYIQFLFRSFNNLFNNFNQLFNFKTFNYSFNIQLFWAFTTSGQWHRFIAC